MIGDTIDPIAPDQLPLELAAEQAGEGDVFAALATYDRLLAAVPNDAAIWLQKGLLHADLADFTAAYDAFERARVLAPGNAWVHFQLGLVASSFGRVLAAVGHFQQAYALDPANGELKINLAHARLAAGQWQGAAAVAGPMGDDLPGWWASTRSKAMTVLAAGRARIDELLKLRVARGAPLKPTEALELADLHIKVGNPRLAVPICRGLMSRDTGDFAPVRVFARATAQLQGIVEALRLLDSMQAGFAGLGDYQMEVARYCFEQGDLDRAIVHCAKAGPWMDRRAHGMMLLAAGRWSDLFADARSWMAETTDTTPFALLLRAAAGLGQLPLYGGGAQVAAPSMIPKIIVQFWDSEAIPADVTAAIATWRQYNPGYEHRLYNEVSARTFISAALGERAASAFDHCRHPAMKADFFRVCFLVREGGFYVDADDRCVRPIEALREAAGGAELVASLSGDVAPYVHNWFLGAQPGATALTLALDDMIAGVEQAHGAQITADIWHTTGPGLITRSAARWFTRETDVAHKALFLTTRQYRGFAVTLDELDYKKTATGNWRRTEKIPMTEAHAEPESNADPLADRLEANAFEAIYANESWGNGSGPGSHPYWTIEYRAFLERFIALNDVRSIVDVGCGDWQFSRFLNLDGIDYRGFDVVEGIVAENNRRYGRANIRFDVMPEDPAELPVADLFLMKDVLQHLPDADIFRFRDTIFSRYRYALLTNSFEKIDAYRNVDLSSPGEFRCLDLAAGPYNMQGVYLFEYFAQPWERIRTFLVGRFGAPDAAWAPTI